MFEIFKRRPESDNPRTNSPVARSPVPWLSDEVWTEWNQDAPVNEGGEPCPIYNFTLTPVTPDDRQRALSVWFKARGSTRTFEAFHIGVQVPCGDQFDGLPGCPKRQSPCILSWVLESSVAPPLLYVPRYVVYST